MNNISIKGNALNKIIQEVLKYLCLGNRYGIFDNNLLQSSKCPLEHLDLGFDKYIAKKK